MDSDSGIGKKVKIYPEILGQGIGLMSQAFRNAVADAQDKRNLCVQYWYMTPLADYDGVVVTHPVRHFSQIIPGELVKYYIKEV